MGSMLRHLNQTAVWKSAQVDGEGNPLLNLYGDPQYGEAQTIRCRREHVLKDVLTSTGAIVKSTTRYFIDSSTVVKVGDLLDGSQVIDFADYIDRRGVCQGYEVLV